jgi:DNA-binding CsgD family transcriptional regulator
MGIAVATVALHVRGARRKLGAATREQALIIALRRGLIEP